MLKGVDDAVACCSASDRERFLLFRGPNPRIRVRFSDKSFSIFYDCLLQRLGLSAKHRELRTIAVGRQDKVVNHIFDGIL
jgi:hypothetical protein